MSTSDELLSAGLDRVGAGELCLPGPIAQLEFGSGRDGLL